MKALIFLCCSMLVAALSFAQAPVISVNPESLSEGLYSGGTSIQTITVNNLGSGTLHCTSVAEPVSPVSGTNKCLKFDGTNDNAGVANDTTLQLTSQLTIEAWFSFEVGGGIYKPSLISKGRPSPNYEVFFDSTLQTRKIGLTLDPVGTIVSQSNLAAGTWYHVAFTYDGAMIKIYIDGILDKSQAATGTISVSNFSLYFARRDNNSGHKYKGELDDVRLWNIARTQDEILQTMNHELSGTEAGLAGYWKFNEESGNTANDSSPYSNNANLNSGTLRVNSGARITSWLNVAPIITEVIAGSSSALDVSFDATGLWGGIYEGRIIIHNNDPLLPQVMVPVQLIVTPVPQIEVSSTELDFGEVFVGGSSSLNLLVISAGTDTLEIYSISCTNADYEIAPAPLLIPPQDSAYIDVVYSPTAPGNDASVLTILCNSMETPEVSVTLSGIGMSPPVISISPGSLEAALFSGRSEVQPLTVSNLGLNDLEFNVEQMTLLPSWLTVNPSSGICAAGTSMELDVKFNAAYMDGGDYSYNLEFASNDPLSSLVTVAVAMNVTDAPCITSSGDTIFFGTLFFGYDCNRTLEMNLSNIGSLDLLVSDVITLPSVFTATPGFAGIDPGESQVFDVTFAPSALGEYIGELNFINNDPLAGEYTVILKGSFMEPPEIYVTPLSVDADLYSGKSATKYITVSNTGESDLEFEITDYALQFDGWEDYVTVGNPSLYNLNSFTLEAWIDMYDYRYLNPFITFGNNDSERFSFECYYYEYLRYTQDWNGNYNEIISYYIYPGPWFHFAVTHDGSTVKLYINGNLVNSAQMPSPQNFSDDYTLYFGNEIGGGSEYFYGMMDDIRIWNYARSQEQIQAGMEDNLSGSENGLVGCWRFDNPSSTVVHDASINGNDGTLHGNATYYSQTTLPSWLTVNPVSGVVPPGSSMDVQVIFDASLMAEGAYNGNFVISSNDPAYPSVNITASMEVTDAPSIVSETGMLDFGEVFIGYSDTLDLLIENNGSQDLLIFSTETNPGVYTVFPPYAGLDPGETEVFTVTFSPAVTGDFPGELILNCNDPLFGEYIVFLDGIALIPPVISISPYSLDIDVYEGQTASMPFTIYNNGGSNLNFNITPGEPGTNFVLEFTGSDNYVDAGNNLNIANASFTLEAWVKKNVSGPGFIFGQGSGNTNYGLHVGFRSNEVFTFAFYANDLDTPYNYTDFEWHHWACTFDDATKVRKIYRDDVELASDITWDNFKGSGKFYVGNQPWLYEGILGFMDDVRIWNVARTKEEIIQNMGHELIGSEQGLLAYWTCDEGTGAHVFDKTPNGNNGILSNGVTWTSSSVPIAPPWLGVSIDSGKIAANASMEINALFNSTGLEPDDYFATIVIASNDPVNSMVTLPVHMVVNSTVGISSDSSSQFAVRSFPNPFYGFTTLDYELKHSATINLSIYNHLGQLVALLVDGEQAAGRQEVRWDASELPAGIYYYKIVVGGQWSAVGGKIVKY